MHLFLGLMKKIRIAIVTYHDRGSYGSVVPDEDEMVLNALKEKGFLASLEVWTDKKVNWKAFDLLLIKSPWDYFNRIEEWYAWLDEIEVLGVKVFNPVSVLRWNTDKKYLMEMASAGIYTLNTLILDRPEKLNVQLFEKMETDKLVIKPKISGGAKQTFVLDKIDFESKKESLEELIAEEDYLVQPYMPQVASDGEWSLVFFGGEFSHALIKKPKSGDFRVQHYFGGTIESIRPSAEILEQAQKVVNEFASECLYARVDGLWVDGQLQLMELELIEPYLFLFTDDKALGNYVSAIEKLVK